MRVHFLVTMQIFDLHLSKKYKTNKMQIKKKKNEGVDKSLYFRDDWIKKSIKARKNNLHHKF